MSTQTSTGQFAPRLLVLASTYPRWSGDPEPGFVHALCRRLTEAFEVHVVCPHARGALAEEVLDGVVVHRFRYAPGALESIVHGGGILSNLRHHPWKWLLVPLFFLGMYWKSWRLVHKLQPTCVHAHWIIPQGLVYAGLRLFQRKPVPMLLTAHGGDLFALRSSPMIWLKNWVVREANMITVVSQTMVAEATHLGAQPSEVHVVPMGVDFDVFTPDTTDARSSHELLFVGRLVEKKGLRLLLEAMPLVVAKIPQSHLTIVGRGPEERLLRTLAETLGIGGKVRFLGALPHAELPALYRRAALFVAPFVEASSGDREGLGLVTVEALACACPVIVGDLPALDDILEPEDTNLRVNPRLPQDLAEHIVNSLKQPEAARAQAFRIRTRLLAHMSWEHVTRQYTKLLSEVQTRK
ncbi:MAG: glycosyltransferase family 4 protein [Pseudomonadota bacterium]